MKKIIPFVLLLATILCSCEKEPCSTGTIQVTNTGSVPVVVYSIESRPTLLPGESIGQPVPFCDGFDVNGNECSDVLTTAVSFKFEEGEMRSQGAIVHRCQTTEIEISN